MRFAVALSLACATLALIACSPPAQPQPATATPVAVPPEASAAVNAAMQAAASHLGVSPDQLQVTQVQPQQWPDASLGCPQPGQLYSQIVTPGYSVVISSGSHELEYHTDARSRATLCRET